MYMLSHVQVVVLLLTMHPAPLELHSQAMSQVDHHSCDVCDKPTVTGFIVDSERGWVPCCHCGSTARDMEEELDILRQQLVNCERDRREWRELAQKRGEELEDDRIRPPGQVIVRARAARRQRYTARANAQRQVEAASLVHSVVADNNPEGAGANNGC